MDAFINVIKYTCLAIVGIDTRAKPFKKMLFDGNLDSFINP